MTAEAVAGVSQETRLALLTAMLAARITDETEQGLKRRGHGHFQLSCAGHEALAAVAFAMRPEDWLHPYYRDRAMVMARGVTAEECFLDFYSKADSPTGGRQMPVHYNSRRLRIVAHSSSVGTNMLQAVGMALSLKERKVPEVVVACTGEAATREGEALEAIAQAAEDKLPVVFVIEDNGFGISTRTNGRNFWTIPNGTAEGREAIKWLYGCRVEIMDGLDPVTVLMTASAAIERARTGAGPTCLVAKTERIRSHSSSDDQRIYRSAEEIQDAAAKDPVKRYVERCLRDAVITPRDLAALQAKIGKEVEAASVRACRAREPDPASVKGAAFAPLPDGLPEREQHLPSYLSKRSGGLTMAQCIDAVLEQEMRLNGRVVLFGEDIEDPKGDVFGVTRGLSRQFPGRVRNSPIAEATIIGTSVGRALMGDLPVAAIQFVDFIGPGLNQLINEVTTLHWRSMGQWNSAMVIMAPCGGYLPGLGPWHSQTNEALFAHLPGLHVVVPSSPGDAAGLLRYALRCNRPVLFLYPKALLHSAEDTVEEPTLDCMAPFGQARVVREGSDVTLVTWGNCVTLCRAAAAQAAKEGIECEILDLRSITPWDTRAVRDSVIKTGRLLVVHEDAQTCGFGAEIIATTVSTSFELLRAVPGRVTRGDDHIPYNHALELSVLPSVEGVLAGIRQQHRQDLRPGRKDLERIAKLGIGIGTAAVLAGVEPASRVPPAPVAEMQPASVEQVDILVLRQSPTDQDATVVRFMVEAGQQVTKGTVLAELEANKGTFEVECTHDGKVARLHAKPGERVRVETPLVTLDVSGVVTGGAGETAQSTAAPRLREQLIGPAQMQVGALCIKSQHEIPTVNVECEVDVTEVARQRDALKRDFESRFSIRPTYTHFILWSLVKAMQEERHEGFRGRLSPSGDRLVIEPHVHVGFAAVGPKESLYSPVVKNADTMTFHGFCRCIHAITEKVRAGTVVAADLQGATVTLTNIGAFDATGGTPFIIPGQLAMLTAGSILERPRFVEGVKGQTRSVEPRMLLQLKLVFDHRPFNGSHAASFLRTIKRNLENVDLRALLEEGPETEQTAP
jgi:2-oxoisovalerate dehydrogenase E1 component